MSLRKEPQRRYASVEQFSEDVRRYLEGRPVIARSDTFGYRSAKFLGRNAPVVIGGTLVGMILIAATVTSERAAIRESTGRATAERRLQVVEAATVRQERDIMDAYLRLGNCRSRIQPQRWSPIEPPSARRSRSARSTPDPGRFTD